MNTLPVKNIPLMILLTIGVGFFHFSCTKANTFVGDNQSKGLLFGTFKNIQQHSEKPAFKVIGYLPAWAGEIKDVQFDKLTHVNYAFVLPTASGGLKEVENIPKLKLLISKAHSNDVKVLISIGGWNYGDDSAFESLAGNAAYRTNFTNNLLKLIDSYKADGIDIDWESPEVGASADNFSILMHQLSTRLHDKGKILSASVSIDHGNAINKNIFDYVDYLNLMAYEGREGNNHSPYSLAVTYLKYWKGRGLIKSKAMLGIPFFGRSSTEYVLYNTILSRGASPYSDSFQEIGYNGIPTIKRKTDLALNESGGISIWELSGDSTGKYSLLNAINQVITQRFMEK